MNKILIIAAVVGATLGAMAADGKATYRDAQGRVQATRK